jgi:hypothetical protein
MIFRLSETLFLSGGTNSTVSLLFQRHVVATVAMGTEDHLFFSILENCNYFGNIFTVETVHVEVSRVVGGGAVQI